MSRLIAISDIHGCYDTFYELVIGRINLRKSDKLILLGDYIDRGDKSRESIDFILDLTAKGFNITALAGNHEWMLVESFKNHEVLPLWLMNSGMTTLKSFRAGGVDDIDRKYIDFFINLRFFETAGNYIFVHAGFNDSAADPFSDINGMLWESMTEYINPAFSGKTIIHGHRPKTVDHVKRLISAGSAAIPIDTGCVYEKELGYGYLSALEVNTMNLISVERI